MKHLVLGTAGHVDHGKTALVRALTGVDTDRLEEEKRRGITIVLGFAELRLPDGTQVGIVDVPGHERFINNMLSGIGGIDMVMLVVAADEGVMPQTREHFDICRLLDVKRGLTVLTKTDLVDAEWLEMVREDVSELISGTFLEGGGIYPVSARTGEGIPELLQGIGKVTKGIEDRETSGIFRLPVDRVFTIKGFGTVVTGTLVSGKIRNGDVVEVLPAGFTAKVRGVQVHSRDVITALSGQRTALNLQGVEKDRIRRGDTLTAPGGLSPTYMLDTKVTILPDLVRPIRNRGLVRFYIGAGREIGNLVLLDRDEVSAGEEAYVQIRLRGPVAAMGGDRFILRSISENRTIGGGYVLDPFPGKHRASDSERVLALKILESGSLEEKAEVFLRYAGFRGMDLAGFRSRLSLDDETLRKMLQKLRERGVGVTVTPDTFHLMHHEYWEELRERTIGILTDFHRDRPLEPGLPKAELYSRLSVMVSEKGFQSLLRHLEREEIVSVEGKRIRLFTYKVRLAGDQADAAGRIERLYEESGLKPPYSRSLPDLLGLDAGLVADLMRHLVEQKRLVHVQGDLFMNPASLENAREKLQAFLTRNREISVPEMRDLLGLTRKYLIPLLEYFDGIGFTARKGDVRVLR